MDIISAEDKDKVLKWFYEADVNGKELPQDCLPERSDEISSILAVDGYVMGGRNRGKLTLKGQAFYLNGGYVREREEKERPLKIAEEANKKANRANNIAILAIIVSITIGSIGFFQKTKKDSSSQYMDNIKANKDSTDAYQKIISSDTLSLNQVDSLI